MLCQDRFIRLPFAGGLPGKVFAGRFLWCRGEAEPLAGRALRTLLLMFLVATITFFVPSALLWANGSIQNLLLHVLVNHQLESINATQTSPQLSPILSYINSCCKRGITVHGSHILLAHSHFLLHVVNDFVKGWIAYTLAHSATEPSN